MKGSIGRYVELQAVGVTELVNPMLATGGTTTTRSWSDANGNFAPDCNLTNPVLNGECGPSTNTNFGRAIVTTRYPPGLTEGWGNRGFNWEIAAGIQHELLSGLSIESSYHRRWFGNLRVLDNLDVTPANYDPYCVTTPVDSRLPGGGGQSLCGLADINPAKLGLNTNEWIRADDLGARQVFDGVDVNVNTRLRQGVILQGGVSVGRLSASLGTEHRGRCRSWHPAARANLLCGRFASGDGAL